MKRILVSNDDGIDAPGIRLLAQALETLGEVTVVAPEREQSAASHSLTLHKPLRVYNRGPRRYAVSGTPTDCVSMALHQLMPKAPDIVVSGINRGANLGDDVTYSGTVSAAMEGTLLNIPSIAISQLFWEDSGFDAAARFAVELVRIVLARQEAGDGLPADTLLNVNVPDRSFEQLKGMRWTVQGKRRFTQELVIEKTDPRGRKYYWVGGTDLEWEGNPNSDYHAVCEGYVSVTPVHLDLTNHKALARLSTWGVDWPGDDS